MRAWAILVTVEIPSRVPIGHARHHRARPVARTENRRQPVAIIAPSEFPGGLATEQRCHPTAEFPSDPAHDVPPDFAVIGVHRKIEAPAQTRPWWFAKNGEAVSREECHVREKRVKSVGGSFH